MMMISLIHLLIAFSFYSLSLSKTTDQSCPKLDQHQACPFNGQPIDESNTKLIQVFMVIPNTLYNHEKPKPNSNFPGLFKLNKNKLIYRSSDTVPVPGYKHIHLNQSQSHTGTLTVV